ncbi:MAG: BTAD domain-containing putative transcriptional regulator [Acidimicrobiales bacterium]
MNARAQAGVPTPPVRVDVLGPLRLTVDNEPVNVPGPKRRALLALLAKAEAHVVPVDDLLDALWPTDLPGSARSSLHSHVSRLRGHLGQAASRLEGLAGAYRLRLGGDGCGTDVVRARSLLAAAKAAADHADACRLLGEARSLWRGPPLAEFIDVAPLSAWAVALSELQRGIEDAHVVAALDAGAVGDAVELATELVAGDPLSEPAVTLLMRALDATGRGADALRAGHHYRRRLAEATGLDPSPTLGELERAIAGRTSSRPGAVPRPAGRLRGRDSELAGIHRLLAHERLVTLLGAGGVGKTRLAGEIATGAEHATALWLSAVTDASAIPHALAAALGLHVVHGDVLSACAALLAPGYQLLLIDNCEHLLAGVRDVVAMLLDTCPRLTVLATSREPLGLAAEQRFRLAPLPLTSPYDLDDIARAPAVAVFIDRAHRVQPGFAPGAEELRLVAEIVRRLDGMPLAIELAAGRLSSLELADLHDRLDRSLDLLGEGRAGTLRQTIDWSYALLPEDEQRLFRHLGIFPDGFDLATAEAVAADLRVPDDAASAVAHLVDASVIEAALGGEPRYRMLDIMRSFARDQLEAQGEADAATERFLQWAIGLAAWIDRTSDTDRESRADRVLRRELANLRAAWRLARAHDRLDNAVRMLTCLADTAGWRDLTEVWAWGLELAEDPAIETHPDAVSVLGLAAASAWSRGELERADRLARRGLGRAGDGAWRCQAALALAALSGGNLADAVTLGTKAAAHATRADQSLGVAALAAAYRGDLDEATALNQQLAAISASLTIQGFHCYVAGEIAALGAEADRAEDRYERSIALARESGATFLEGIASVGLLTLRANTNRIADALEGYRHLVDYWERTGGWVQQWTTLRNLARLLSTLGDEETALLLNAAADRAPDAPTTIDSGDGPHRYRGSADEAGHIFAQAACTDRVQILEIARQAIARHAAATRAGA